MTDEKKTQSVSNKAQTIAVAALREAHRDEYDTLLTAAYESLGAERKVRRTPEQVAADKAAAAQARADAKEAKARESALAAARALAIQYPEFVSVNETVADEV